MNCLACSGKGERAHAERMTSSEDLRSLLRSLGLPAFQPRSAERIPLLPLGLAGPTLKFGFVEERDAMKKYHPGFQRES